MCSKSEKILNVELGSNKHLKLYSRRVYCLSEFDKKNATTLSFCKFWKTKFHMKCSIAIVWLVSFVLIDNVTWSLAACRLVDSVTQHRKCSVTSVEERSFHSEPTCVVIVSLHEEMSIIEELSKARKFIPIGGLSAVIFIN